MTYNVLQTNPAAHDEGVLPPPPPPLTQNDAGAASRRSNARGRGLKTDQPRATHHGLKRLLLLVLLLLNPHGDVNPAWNFEQLIVRAGLDDTSRL